MRKLLAGLGMISLIGLTACQSPTGAGDIILDSNVQQACRVLNTNLPVFVELLTRVPPDATQQQILNLANQFLGQCIVGTPPSAASLIALTGEMVAFILAHRT